MAKLLSPEKNIQSIRVQLFPQIFKFKLRLQDATRKHNKRTQNKLRTISTHNTWKYCVCGKEIKAGLNAGEKQNILDVRWRTGGIEQKKRTNKKKRKKNERVTNTGAHANNVLVT